MYRNRERFIKIVVWFVVVAMLLTIAASLLSVLGG
jgi:hypothetical protein